MQVFAREEGCVQNMKMAQPFNVNRAFDKSQNIYNPDGIVKDTSIMDCLTENFEKDASL